MFQSAEETLPPCRMHLIGDVCLPGALLLDSMLFLRDLLVHSGVTPGRTEITHGVEAIPRRFAEQVTSALDPNPGGRIKMTMDVTLRRASVPCPAKTLH